MGRYVADNIFRTYDVKGGDPGTTVCDLSIQQVFEFDNPTSLDLSFINVPAVGRGKAIIVRIDGAGSVSFNFDGYTVDWENGGAENEPPDIYDNWTTWRFMLTGSKLSGGNFGG